MLHLKRALLLFWALYLTLVVASNVCDALKELGYLGETWRFHSGNFQFLAATTSRYDKPAWLDGFLFAGVIAWEALAAVLYWLAWWELRGRTASQSRFVVPACGVSLMLWAAFLLADEFFIAFPVAATHRQLFTAQLASLLVLLLLPDHSK